MLGYNALLTPFPKIISTMVSYEENGLISLAHTLQIGIECYQKRWPDVVSLGAIANWMNNPEGMWATLDVPPPVPTASNCQTLLCDSESRSSIWVCNVVSLPVPGESQ